MAGITYVTKGYSTYTDIPTQQGGYDHGSNKIDWAHTPTTGYTDFVGSPSKNELLKEYVHSPTKFNSPNHGFNYENSSSPTFHNEGSWSMKSSPKKYPHSSPVHGYHSDESHMVQSGPGFVARQVRTGIISGPPMTHHPITTSTNNINEALGFLESMTHSPRSDPRQRGVLDELSIRAQPVEPQKRYARPTFVAKPNDVYRNNY
ncbi:hypothetical protein Lser_V15G37542 [Lactuca serriola]